MKTPPLKPCGVTHSPQQRHPTGLLCTQWVPPWPGAPRALAPGHWRGVCYPLGTIKHRFNKLFPAPTAAGWEWFGARCDAHTSSTASRAGSHTGTRF